MTSDVSPERHAIRPYARLLTMLGEQLIKSDRIALVELIKNSYDADATDVVVNLFDGPGATISLAVVDNGQGMSLETVRNDWLNPATPFKARPSARRRTPRGRFVQGEKGIGRFALFKLGSVVEVTTRASDSVAETTVQYDLRLLDRPDSQDLFLDEIAVSVSNGVPAIFNGVNADGLRSTHGTRLVISHLRSEWSEESLRRAYRDVARLQPLVPGVGPEGLAAHARQSDFTVAFQRAGRPLPFEDELKGTLQHLLKDRAVLTVQGQFLLNPSRLAFTVNGVPETVSLTDPSLVGLGKFRRYFGDGPGLRDPEGVQCGPFSFQLYIFDLSSRVSSRFRLDPEEKALVKDHRIYLYRDGVRVLPYGDAEDDWLEIDVIRGTQGASRVLSNDQTVGFVYITHTGNPRLRDKTNREGLLDDGMAYQDFVRILQVAISYLRRGHFARYLADQARAQDARQVHRRSSVDALGALARLPDLPTSIKTEISSAVEVVRAEQRLLVARAERTEDLAGVGLSVEAASHDIVATAAQALRVARELGAIVEDRCGGDAVLHGKVEGLIDGLSFVVSRLADIQGLFVSTRQRRQELVVAPYVERVQRMYRSLISELSVDVVIQDSVPPLAVMTTEAALMQVLVNLFDNAVYWLRSTADEPRKILVRMDAGRGTLTFADSGPGVSEVDAPYIFEPFYSGKGEAGKGLGLYIARQVGARNGFSVRLTSRVGEAILPGANFILEFAKDGGRL